jgi:acetamidase/formamidase
MRLCISPLLVSAAVCFAQPAAPDIAGAWVFMVERQGDGIFAARGQLSVDGGKVTGKIGALAVRGTAKGPAVDLEWLDGNGKVRVTLTGRREGGRLSGMAADPANGLTYTWTATPDTPRAAAPRTHDFAPTEFQRYFSATIPPVLRINPGDTVRTWSVDAGGTDASGQRRSLGGNPLTGPFYVEGAIPGDTLAVRLARIRINRDWAQSGTAIVSNAVTPDYVAGRKGDPAFSGRWRLDARSGTASLENAGALKDFRVPIEPMLGCVAVAPPRQEVVSTRDSGAFGGNMDYNRLREGAVVYLPVYHPGALLFIGDGHAAQGDGELTGDALETSMEFEFTVDLIRGQTTGMPYAEDGEYWMVIAISGSLDDALRRATAGMARYLESEHGLNSSEAAVVMGFAVKYQIADLVGRQVSIVAKLPKATIAQLPPPRRRE